MAVVLAEAVTAAVAVVLAVVLAVALKVWEVTPTMAHQAATELRHLLLETQLLAQAGVVALHRNPAVLSLEA